MKKTIKAIFCLFCFSISVSAFAMPTAPEASIHGHSAGAKK